MTDPKIPMLDLGPELALLAGDLDKAWRGVLDSGRFINGPNVTSFESEVADFLGSRWAIGVNSGTDALVIGLRTLGIGPGDEVITPAFTFFATAEAVSAVGATPVFVDIDGDTFNIDSGAVGEAVTDRTRAIIPVHLFGRPAAMDPIRAVAKSNHLGIVEDVAQAFGSSYQGRKLGTLADIGAFSFFPSKNLGAYGDGGLIVTDDEEIAEAARMLRAHGGKDKYRNEMIGYNSRLDELQAAILRIKLPLVPSFNAGRKLVAGRYDEALSESPGLVTPQVLDDDHVFHQYTVRVLNGERDRVKEHLHRLGIASAVYYPVPLHRLPMYSSTEVNLPEAERAAGEVLSLPMWPQMDEETQARVCEAVIDAVGGLD